MLTARPLTAAGKGVILPSTKEEAHAALNDIMLEKEFGAAGDEVVIEEFVRISGALIISCSFRVTAHVVRVFSARNLSYNTRERKY